MPYEPSLTDIILALVISILTSASMRILFGVILLDLGLGIAHALKEQRFEWGRVADFYRTNVGPYLVGYVTLHLVISFIIPPDSLAGLGDVLSPALVTGLWGLIMVALSASIARHLQALGLTPPVGTAEKSQ
jgi:hypothetical protein